MKKTLVYVKDFGRFKVGDLEHVMDASDMDGFHNTATNDKAAVKITIPAELEDVPLHLLKGEKVAPSQAYWSKDGEADVYEEPADLDGWTFNDSVPEHYLISKNDNFVAYDKNQRVQKKFNDLNLAVGAEMKQVYNTTNPDSAVANYLTWLAMKANPAKFSTKNLVARFEVVGLSIGDALNTETKITDYATALIDLADDYAIWREQQILNYVVEKGQIEAE